MTFSAPPPAHWRADIDSLAFQPPWHDGQCIVHRLAFRTLLGIETTPQACLDYFHEQRPAFEAAATAKIERRGLPPGASFHLNSRDVARVAGKSVN